MIDIIKKGLQTGVIKLMDSPNGDGTVCQIGEHWFYFGGLTAEEYTAKEYREAVPEEEIAAEIFNVLKTDDLDEYNYLVGILSKDKESAPSPLMLADRAISLLRSAMDDEAESVADSADLMEIFHRWGLTDSEIEMLGYGYLLEIQMEEEV